MAKLERVTAKVFASDAPADKIGQFGSALAGTKLETGDVSTIQALPAYTEGWSSAVISQRNYPVLQETNGVMKNMSYQTAYIMQNGIAEYDPNTEYYTGSICKGIGNTNQYASWGDENVGNAVTNSDYWKNVTPVNYSNITNCLLEVPQRIKYDLTDGTLTIKAGSVVIVPYGVEDLTSQYPKGTTFIHENFKVYDTQFADGKFFVWAEIQNDIVDANTYGGTNNKRVIDVALTTNAIGANLASASGTSATTSQYCAYYNTSANKVGFTSSSTTVDYSSVMSFLIANTTVALSGSVTSSIDQVFNGIGYIGSTMWRDKDVKSLAPNGRNEDGSLNNIERISNDISVFTVPATENDNFHIGIHDNNKLTYYTPHVWTYNDKLNSIDLNGSPRYGLSFAGMFTVTNGVITSFNPKQPFRAIDYSDKSIVSGWGMPSDKYIILTAGASGATYTAPANGYFTGRVTGQNCYIDAMFSNYKGIGIISSASSSRYSASFILPVLKEQKVIIEYSGTIAYNGIQFVYAQGEG